MRIKFIALILGILILPFTIGAWALTTDTWLNRTFGVANDNSKTDRIRQSNQYVDSVQSQMLNLLTEYSATSNNDTAHRAAIINQLWDLRSKLTEDNVPLEVKDFLTTHPRGSK